MLALFWPRINEAGAFWTLIITFVVGISRFVRDGNYSTIYIARLKRLGRIRLQRRESLIYSTLLSVISRSNRIETKRNAPLELRV